MTTTTHGTGTTAEPGRYGVELNGINVIAESERKGDAARPVLAVVRGQHLGAGDQLRRRSSSASGSPFWQATIAAVVGIVLSFALCGVVALAGKRGSAPTMVLSRAPFGVKGNALPTFLSWVLLVGWETVLVSLASLGTATVFGELGWGGGDATKVLGFLVTAALVIVAGVLGFDVIMRLQTLITIATIVLTIGFIALTLDEVDWTAVSDAKAGSTQAFIGALALVATGFGVGWANTAADYSRYLPRRAVGSRGVRVDDVRRRGRAGRPHGVRHPARAVEHRPVRRHRG